MWKLLTDTRHLDAALEREAQQWFVLNYGPHWPGEAAEMEYMVTQSPDSQGREG